MNQVVTGENNFKKRRIGHLELLRIRKHTYLHERRPCPCDLPILLQLIAYSFFSTVHFIEGVSLISIA